MFSNDSIFSQLNSDSNSISEVYSHGGRKNLGIDALKWLKFCESLGAGEILLTSMDHDGTQSGYDDTFLSLVKQSLSIPLIASGGAGTVQHICSALKICDAALLASLLHYGTFTIPEIKDQLKIESDLIIR